MHNFDATVPCSKVVKYKLATHSLCENHVDNNDDDNVDEL